MTVLVSKATRGHRDLITAKLPKEEARPAGKTNVVLATHARSITPPIWQQYDAVWLPLPRPWKKRDPITREHRTNLLAPFGLAAGEDKTPQGAQSPVGSSLAR